MNERLWYWLRWACYALGIVAVWLLFSIELKRRGGAGFHDLVAEFAELIVVIMIGWLAMALAKARTDPW